MATNTNTNPIKYINPIDLQGYELINALTEKLASAPSSPVAGRVYYNTTENTLYFYNGSTWTDIGTHTAVGQVYVEAYETLAAYIAGKPYNPADFNEGDVLVLSSATDPEERAWINLGTNVGDATDFTNLSVAYSEAEIEAMFSAGTGLQYSSGVYSIADGGVDTTQLADGSVTVGKIGSNAVTADKINADAVTAAKINADVAGDGLVPNGTTGALDVNADDSTLEISGDALQVKDLGITEAKLATAVTDKLDYVHEMDFSLDTNGGTGMTYNTGVFTLTHNWGTRNVAVVMMDSLDDYEQVPVVSARPSDNTVTIKFADAPVDNQYKIMLFRG